MENFHYPPKRAECLREIQQVLNIPQFKIVKPSDTQWLAHECCVKVVKENYCVIILAFSNIYEKTPEPETLGISRPCSTLAMFLLDQVLPQVGKLGKALQNLDITIISSLVEAMLYTIDDAMTPVANWVLTLHDMEESLDKNISIKITVDDIKSFQENFGIPLKANIFSRFGSQDVISAFSIFDPKIYLK